MGSIEDHLHQLLRQSSNSPQNLYEHWEAFSSAINWQERWIQCLVAFHVFCLLLVCIFRKNIDLQTAVFLVLILLVAMAERINSYCSIHWRTFAKQNYFDEHGVFAGLLFSGPLLMILLLQLINFLALTSSALIKSKRLQLVHQSKKKEVKTD